MTQIPQVAFQAEEHPDGEPDTDIDTTPDDDGDPEVPEDSELDALAAGAYDKELSYDSE